MYNRIGILFMILVLMSLTNVAQQNDIVTGTILDNATKNPIAFATIRLKTKALGVISNQNGDFRIPQRFLKFKESLIVSCLGYETTEIRFSDLELGKENIIRLKASALELEETIVVGRRKKTPSPRKIIKRAIEKIPYNFSFQPFSYIGYYRDYQVKNAEYLNLNEAILQVFDKGFNTNDYLSTQSQIFDYQKNFEFKRDDKIARPYDYATRNKVVDNAELYSFGGNEFFILRIHDAIRNFNTKSFSYIDILEKDLIRNHSLKREKDVDLGDEKLFVIGLESSNSNFDDEEYAANKNIVDIRSEGRLYVSQKTYAIHRLTYKMFDYTKIQKSRQINGDVRPKLLYEIALEYSKYSDKMYPHYVSVHNAFKVRRSYFYVEEIVFEMDKKRFVIKTNQPPIFVVEQGLPNVVLKYKKRKLSIGEMRNSQDGILIYPDEGELHKIFRELELEQNLMDETIINDLFHFEFSNIKDKSGNTLNDFVYEDYDQYREFFTQQVIKDSVTLPSKEFLMKKNKPIYKDQPIFKPDNFDDFWMNTPLKTKP